MRVTVSEFRKAMVIVETYCNQVGRPETKNKSEIGCRVRLSAHGLEMQGRRHRTKIGTVVDYLNYQHPGDGVVTVKWDSVKKPDSMHISQVEAINTLPSPPLNH